MSRKASASVGIARTICHTKQRATTATAAFEREVVVSRGIGVAVHRGKLPKLFFAFYRLAIGFYTSREWMSARNSHDERCGRHAASRYSEAHHVPSETRRTVKTKNSAGGEIYIQKTALL